MTERGAAQNLEANQPHCLVMGFDFSEGAEVALDQALALSGLLPSATLHVVWVVGSPDAAQAERLRNYVATRVRFAANRLDLRASYGQVQVRVHALAGSPAQVINDVAFRQGAHMVVVGSHGRAGLERVVLGCVAADVLATAPCPVVIARPRAVDQLLRARSRLPAPLAIRPPPPSGSMRVARLPNPVPDVQETTGQHSVTASPLSSSRPSLPRASS